MAHGVVKFFNAAKGFGFISPDDGSADIFVHISALHNSGLDNVNEGDQVNFEVEQDRRTGKLNAVDIQVTSAAPPRQRGFGGGRDDRGPPRDRGFGGGDRGGFGGGGYGGGQSGSLGSGSGVVKWFNPTKGFGFIQPSDGGADIFVHISAVERAGLRGLNDGQSVTYDLEADRRSGKTSAVNLRVG